MAVDTESAKGSDNTAGRQAIRSADVLVVRQTLRRLNAHMGAPLGCTGLSDGATGDRSGRRPQEQGRPCPQSR